MLKHRRLFSKVLALIICLVFASLFIGQGVVAASETPAVKGLITNITGIKIDNNISSYFDESVVYALPKEIEKDEIISVIVSIDMETVYDSYHKLDTDMSIGEYSKTANGLQVARRINTQVERKIKQLKSLGIDFKVGEMYDTLLAGFEIETKASNFNLIKEFLNEETLILGETYAKCETEVVTNDVDVYDTGIFDSSLCEYQGDGVVIAVLDTGLDYTHTAFSVDNFTTSNEAFTLDNVSQMVPQTTAAKFTSGLTGEDVYVSKKVPYAYDYADKDPDVAPINSEHGTHVAGIIAGKDKTITGVAPNAQLAIFKVFSDHQEGAKTSWIIAALEDCVVLGVDVINMSLGSACGFTREVDKENVNKVYDKVYESGIELIASAANQYNATMGSSKNGNNGLTSNPDSGTVGAPSTYKPALSVASVNGTKTSYLKIGEQIIYFNEAFTNSADDTKSFVDDILNTISTDTQSYDFEYVAIPGLGRSSDYPQVDEFYQGKIVLVKRGTTTFEDKVRVALLEKGASGIIIYNNVSGTISMSVGANVGAVCSISQDDGKYLISQIDPATGIGKLSISRDNLAGPFMSDFSSWGPTSDLLIKPEITAHGGNILSAVPGQDYEKLSGTSMAAPNLAGAAALICQYVKYSGVFGENLTTREVTNIVNQLMMSTADIIHDKNGLPSAVRKQGAGLISIGKSTSAEAYLSTFDKDGNKMDKAKVELGDDKSKTGVYEMTIAINNVSSSKTTYNVGGIVLTEGVSTTYTSHGEQTVTQNEYALSGAKVEVLSVTNGTSNGNKVEVNSKQTATVKVKITLSDADKKYLNESFANGMYVEGWITFEAQDGTKVDLSTPFLAFYGDWTKAPIFDEEYYDTHADEINKGLDDEDKLMADTVATKVIGGLYSDYISTLGTYYFVQNPKATQIAASKDHIAVSNQNKGQSNGSTISSIRSVSAGLLRNVKEIYISIVEDSTGKEVYTDLVSNQRKSYSSGSTIYGSSIDIDYSILEHNLKNNSTYTCTLTAYIDYGTNETQNNERNTFSFPFYVDFEAPIVTDVKYRTEYDRTTKNTKLFADLSIYDNHYSMGVQVGQITKAPEGSEYTFSMNTFGKYVTPIYSSYNSNSIVSIELTDYISELKNSCGITYNSDGTSEINYNNNSFIATVYDYAMNSGTYEIKLPDEIIYMYFNQEEKKLSPNETLDLSTVLTVYPGTSWIQTLDFESSNETIVGIVNNTLIAKKSGTAKVTATGKDSTGNTVSTSMDVTVLSPGDEGYVGNYSIPEINRFELTGYETIKAYYFASSDERKIGVTGGEYAFGDTIELELYPSEQVKLLYALDSYFPEATNVTFKASNSKIATVTEDGIVTGLAKGNTTIMINVLYNGKSTLYSAKVAISVKDPFSIQSIYLYWYKGLGGTVTIPGDRGITTIYNYAFSNYEYVEKDLENGDVIDEEDPYLIKQQYIGDDTITKVIIPEGVTTINSYAFANLTALEEVVLPSTLTRIGVGAFYNCTKLTKINLENVKFINEKAFYNCPLTEIDLASTVSIGTYAFQNCKLNYVVLPASAQSLSDGAFYNNPTLTSVTIKANKIKIGNYAFYGCKSLQSININAAVISSYAFFNCEELSDVTLGADVSVIGEGAFYNTSVEKFKLSAKNKLLSLEEDGALVLKGDELILVAPGYKGTNNTVTTSAVTISSGAFMGNAKIFKLVAPNLKNIGSYAFAFCTNLYDVEMPEVENIGDFAFYMDLKLTDIKTLSSLKQVGDYAFYDVPLEELTIVDNVNIGAYAFANDVRNNLPALKTVTLGNNVTVGDYAFYVRVISNSYEATNQISSLENYYTVYSYEVTDEDGNVVEVNSYYKYDFTSGVKSVLETVNAGENVNFGFASFFGNGVLTTVNVGDNAVIGERAFYSCAKLDTLDFTKVKSIGEYAFAGYRTQDFWVKENQVNYAYEKEYDDGVFTYTAYIYSCFAPCFTSVDLSKVESVGSGAFLGNTALTNVVVSDSLNAIGEYAFANCNSLKSITLKENVTSIGDYAFYNSGLETINLDNIDSIGEAAFYNTKINSIKFKDGVTIGDRAFYYAKKLSMVDNTKNIASVGAYAFSLTSINEIDLSSAITIGDFAFSQSKLTSVKLGEELVELGENPFYGCEIESFGKETVIQGNGYTHKEITETYDLNKNVKVIDGVLYQAIPTGYELVSYPMLKDLREYTIYENTTRITAAAFAYSKLENVTLSNVLKSIGDKAFYGCDNLSVVVFTSYIAPKLEEEYDTSYLTYLNLPISGNLGEYEGLGISKYYMWNVTSNFTNFYFGANFKDYIGHNTGDLVIARPVNGQNYDSFIFGQYFDTVVYGASAPTLATLNVIKLINNLPANITLSSEAVITAAREAYNTITSTEQQALVTNYNNLVSAESTLTYLKNREEQNQPGGEDEPVKPAPNANKFATFMKNNAVGFGFSGVLIIAFAVVLFVLLKRKRGEE